MTLQVTKESLPELNDFMKHFQRYCAYIEKDLQDSKKLSEYKGVYDSILNKSMSHCDNALNELKDRFGFVWEEHESDFEIIEYEHTEHTYSFIYNTLLSIKKNIQFIIGLSDTQSPFYKPAGKRRYSYVSGGLFFLKEDISTLDGVLKRLHEKPAPIQSCSQGSNPDCQCCSHRREPLKLSAVDELILNLPSYLKYIRSYIPSPNALGEEGKELELLSQIHEARIGIRREFRHCENGKPNRCTYLTLHDRFYTLMDDSMRNMILHVEGILRSKSKLERTAKANRNICVFIDEISKLHGYHNQLWFVRVQIRDHAYLWGSVEY